MCVCVCVCIVKAVRYIYLSVNILIISLFVCHLSLQPPMYDVSVARITNAQRLPRRFVFALTLTVFVVVVVVVIVIIIQSFSRRLEESKRPNENKK